MSTYDAGMPKCWTRRSDPGRWRLQFCNRFFAARDNTVPPNDSTKQTGVGTGGGGGGIAIPFFSAMKPAKTHVKGYLAEQSEHGATTSHDSDFGGATSGDDTEWLLSSKPVADLFTETTIMFADIWGFNA